MPVRHTIPLGIVIFLVPDEIIPADILFDRYHEKRHREAYNQVIAIGMLQIINIDQNAHIRSTS